jgi:Cu(I)/Ag(I) efflux system membrane fusion protein
MLKRLSYSLVLLATAGGAYLAGSWRAPRELVAAAATPAPGAILHYRCPMHPAITSSSPGTTPCCGMAFEPVRAPQSNAGESVTSPPAIVATAAQQQLIGVRIGTVEEAAATEQVRAFGRVTPDETRVHRLTAGLEAYMTEISAVTTGSRVAKDQWLATYSTPEARLPVSSFITAVNVLDREEKMARQDPVSIAAARTSVGLAVDRLLTLGMSRVQIDEIRRNRATVTAVKITSPVDGFVLARNGAAGQRFDAGAELFQIVDLQRVWILADVPVTDGEWIKPGTPARVSVGGRETPVRARVSRDVPPQFDPATQSFKLRLEADNPGFTLRPDMFVDVDFQVSYGPTLLAPADAVVLSGLSAHVFVERTEGMFERREVRTGRRHGGRVAILKGLQPGERIALSGTFLLDSESRMKANDRPHH